jgi:hypothetical protein
MTGQSTHCPSREHHGACGGEKQRRDDYRVFHSGERMADDGWNITVVVPRMSGGQQGQHEGRARGGKPGAKVAVGVHGTTQRACATPPRHPELNPTHVARAVMPRKE